MAILGRMLLPPDMDYDFDIDKWVPKSFKEEKKRMIEEEFTRCNGTPVYRPSPATPFFNHPKSAPPMKPKPPAKSNLKHRNRNGRPAFPESEKQSIVRGIICVQTGRKERELS